MLWHGKKNKEPSVFFNGAKHSVTDAPAGEHLRINPSFINFPELLKAYIRHLRVSTKVIYTTSFTPPQGETPYGFTSGSTLFYMPLSSSGDTSYISSGSKTINITYV